MTKICKTCGHDEKHHEDWHGLKIKTWACMWTGCTCEKFKSEASHKTKKKTLALGWEKPQKGCGKVLPGMIDWKCGKGGRLCPSCENHSPQKLKVSVPSGSFPSKAEDKGSDVNLNKSKTLGSFNLSEERKELRKRLKDNQPVSIDLIFQYIKTQDKEFIRIFLNEIKNNPRIVNENDLQKMKYIELSYSGDLIPVEEVEFIISRRAGEELSGDGK